MIVSGLLAAGATFRRMVAWRYLLLAMGGGLVAGLAVAGVPAPSLVPEVFVVLVSGLVGMLVVPIAAALPSGDRACGYEQLVGLRPIPSPALALGRVLGCLVGAAVLALLLGHVARHVAAGRLVPDTVPGLLVERRGELSEWRFAVPKGAVGPFDLSLAVHVPLRNAAGLVVDLRRGERHQRIETRVRPARTAVLSVPDLAPARGDLYVRLASPDGLVLGSESPRLTVGQRPLGDAGLLARADGWRAIAQRLALAVLAAICASCAFHFETALLAGLLALLAPSQGHVAATLATVVLLLVFAVLGTALVRRQALP